MIEYWMPKRRRPTPPGIIVRDLLLADSGLSQAEFAKRIGVAPRRLSGVLSGRTRLNADIALRFGRFFNTGADLWLRMQTSVEMWDVLHSSEAKAITKIRPLRKRRAA